MRYPMVKGVAASAALAVVLAGCAGLPQSVVDEAGRQQALIESEARRVTSSERDFESFRQTPEYGAFEAYAEREAWPSHFRAAEAKLRSAESVYKVEILPLIKQDSPDGTGAATAALAKIPPLLDGARRSSRHWVERRDFLKGVSDSVASVMEDCGAAASEIEEAHAGMAFSVERVKRAHPARADDIGQRAAQLSDLRSPSVDAVAAARAEFRKREAGGEFDLAVFADSCREARQNAEAFLKGVPELGARLAELDRSYSRTLMDMKVEHDLLIQRASWNDALDYPTPNRLDYRFTNVERPVFEHLVSIQGVLAAYRRSFFGSRLSMRSGTDERMWSALEIDPLQRWPSGDTDAEYWVQEADSRYFHKYLVQENGATNESDWTPVGEEFFLANIDNLGMDVESKPYGSFESEKLAHAAPPGMAYVGNPHYGRWRSDGAGGSIWAWAGPYLFYSTLFGSPVRYGRSEWADWSGGYRGSRPYYGGTTSAPKWGTRSQTVRTSPRMQGTTLARSGGFRQPLSTVRGAGPAGRTTAFGASGK